MLAIVRCIRRSGAGMCSPHRYPLHPTPAYKLSKGPGIHAVPATFLRAQGMRASWFDQYLTASCTTEEAVQAGCTPAVVCGDGRALLALFDDAPTSVCDDVS